MISRFAILGFVLASLQGETQPSLEAISARYLDKRFKTDALGEGKGQYDSDPLFREDAFDCTTFIETVWAMSKAKTGQDWTKILQDIRYRKGEITFTQRLHFISLDWVPYHLAKGDAQDGSNTLGLKLQESKTLIDRRGWYTKKHPTQLKEFETHFSKDEAQWVTVNYIKFGDLLDSPAAQEKLKAELSRGAMLANFIRPNFNALESIGSNIDITHQGLLLIKDGKITLRHASVTLMKVGDEDFMDYLKFYRHHPNLKGFQLIRLL